MEKIIEGSITIYEALQNIKSSKYVMPAFQRQYVWSMEQIEKLWDSILLDYPIATFLFWHVDDSNVTWDTYLCQFLNNVTFDSRKTAGSVNYELTSINAKYTDTAILDGQQRLTSLFLSLYGEASIRPKSARKATGAKTIAKLMIELNKSKISIDEEEYNSKKFDITFSDKVGKASPTQFEIKEILSDRFQDGSTRDVAIEEAIQNVSADSKDYARNILHTLYKKICVDKLIRYTEMREMNQDDALEMFVRFNSGGRPLRKSDITMSILEAYWPSAKQEFGKILVGSYDGFGTDFIIRTALMLYGDVVKSNINKNVAETLKNDWSDFKNALLNLETLLNTMKIDVSRFSSSWNVLLPIVYYIYFNKDYNNNIHAVRAYLLRAIFFSYFKSGTTGKLKQMRDNMKSFDCEITIEMLNQMGDLRVTDGRIEDVLNSEKGSRVGGEVLYYLSLDWLNKNFKYEQDHLHPDSRFDGNKPVNVPMEDWKKWRGMRNRLPNLHLLVGRSNASKSDMRLVDYYNDMNDAQQTSFFEEAMIPQGTSLELDNFEILYEVRKDAMAKKIRELLG